MRIVKFISVTLTTLLFAHVLHAQTADEIIAKHIDAIGGKDKLSQIKSVYTENSSEAMGNEASSKTYMINGKGFKNEMDFGGQKIVQSFTDKGGWSVNPMMGSADPQPMPADQYNYGRSQIFVGGALYDYASKGNKVELQGKEGNDYKIKVTTASNAEMTYYIDANTYYVTKSTSKTNFQGQETPVTISYSNYKKTDFGNVVPFSTQTEIGQFSLASTLKKIEVNKDIDPKIFDQQK